MEPISSMKLVILKINIFLKIRIGWYVDLVLTSKERNFPLLAMHLLLCKEADGTFKLGFQQGSMKHIFNLHTF